MCVKVFWGRREKKPTSLPWTCKRTEDRGEESPSRCFLFFLVYQCSYIQEVVHTFDNWNSIQKRMQNIDISQDSLFHFQCLENNRTTEEFGNTLAPTALGQTMGWENSLIQSLAGPKGISKSSTVKYLLFNQIPNLNTFSRTPCVSLMWMALAQDSASKTWVGLSSPQVWKGAMLVVGSKSSSSILARIWEPQQCWHWHWGEEKWNQNPEFLNTVQSELRAYCDQKQHIL